MCANYALPGFDMRFHKSICNAISLWSCLTAASRVKAASTTEDGYSNFVLVDVSIASIDWLELKRCGHRRALLMYQADGEHTAT